MASEPDAVVEDADALKHAAALADQTDDAIETLIADDDAAASADREADPEELRAPTSASTSDDAHSGQASSCASSAAKPQPPSSSSNNNAGDATDGAFDAADGDDAAFSFGFPGIGNNQQDELFGDALERAMPVSSSASDAVDQSAQQMHRASSSRVGAATDNDKADPGPFSVLASSDSQATPTTSAVRPLGAAIALDDTSRSALTATTSAKRPAPPPSPMSPTQPFSWNDILRVQNMIERCLQQYLSKVRVCLCMDVVAEARALTVRPCDAHADGDPLGAQRPGASGPRVHKRRVAEAPGAEPVVLPSLRHPAPAQGADPSIQLPRTSARMRWMNE